jgi:hypothetical protein
MCVYFYYNDKKVDRIKNKYHNKGKAEFYNSKYSETSFNLFNSLDNSYNIRLNPAPFEVVFFYLAVIG